MRFQLQDLHQLSYQLLIMRAEQRIPSALQVTVRLPLRQRLHFDQLPMPAVQSPMRYMRDLADHLPELLDWFPPGYRVPLPVPDWLHY